MGGWLSALWWGGDPDARDASSGLSRRDVHLVRGSWAPIYRNRVENGTEILSRLFRASPETKEHFTMLRGVPEAQFGEKFQFTAHVINLMSSLDGIIQSLDRPQLAIAMLQKVGEAHNRRKIPIRHFEVLKNVLVTLFSEGLGFDAATMGAWGRTITFMYGNIYPEISFEER